MSDEDFALGVSLTISVRVTDKTSIELRDADGRRLLAVESPVSLNSLVPYRRKLAAALEQLRKDFRDLTQLDEVVAGRRLADFHRVASGLLQDLFGDANAGDLMKAARICNEVCFGTSREEDLEQVLLPWDRDAIAPKLIKLDYDITTGIALELLPLLNPLPPRRVDDLIQFGRLARQFLGFAAVSHHVNPAAEAPRLSNTPTLPMRLFIHNGLPLRDRTRRFFASANGFSVEQEWPPLSGQDSPSVQLANSLWNHRVDKIGDSLCDEVQLYHFECHCSREKDESVLHFKDRLVPSILRSGVGGALKDVKV